MASYMDKIKEILVDEFGVDESEVTPEAHLIDDLGVIDIELAMSLEEEFGIEISLEDIEKLQTVSDVVKLIENILTI